MNPFVHLHVHSQYSILDGQASIKGLVDKAIANGMRGMALTDHGNMFGIKEFHDYCNKVNGKFLSEIKDLKNQREAEMAKPDADTRVIDDLDSKIAENEAKLFTPIFGCEVYVANTSKETHTDKHDIGRHLILLAKNLQGYHNLVKIVSRAWTDGRYQHPRTDKADIERFHEGIICLSACLGGEVPRLITAGDISGARKAAEWFKGVFGEDYYLEMQLHKATVPNASHDTFPKQQQVNEVLKQFAKELDIKLVCTNDVHFVNEDDADAHERLICLSTGKRIDDTDRMLYTKQEWLKTQEEMNDVFASCPEALANTLEVLGKVETYSINHKPILPDFPLPEGFTDENDYLRHLVYKGAERVWPGDQLDDEKRERIDFELETIKNMGFPGYFLIVQDYINVAPSLGVSVGPGRGSAAGSAVAYCLGITKVDPIKYDLLFERFLNPDRISLPDIDVDFDDDGRAKILNYVTEKYGAEKVAHIITYGTMAAKLSIKDVARVENLSIPESNRLAKFIPSKPGDMPVENGKNLKITITNCLKAFPEFRAELDNPNPKVGETIRFAQKLEGNVRNTGVHACGVIIGRDDISDWVPISTADDKDGGGKLIVTQYEGSVIEDTGLIKMDFLGLKTLSIIMEAIANIKLTHGIDIDIESIPIDDPKTYQLYCEGRTTGTFQFESAGMQKYLIQLQPSTFEDLIAMNALYRPGPMDYIPQFINRKQGRDPIVYDIPCMEKYLKDTYGITVYQEQVMLLSRQLAGFTRGQSDTLRKAMGKKQIEKMNQLEVLFYKGGKENGHDEKVLKKIWEDWKKFASYAFNKSHATCYSWVAYQTAYLKANYPSEYMAAVLSRNIKSADKLAKFMDECKAMGIKVMGPDVNASGHTFTADKQGNIRFGLAGIKSIGGNVAQAIIKERQKGGPFKSIFDFMQRIDLSACNKSAIENLAFAGAFDTLNVPREAFDQQYAYAETLVRWGQEYQLDKQRQTNSLFGDWGEEDTLIAYPEIPKVEAWAPIKRLNLERELVGMYLSAHPLDQFFIEMHYGCNITLRELNAIEKGEQLEAQQTDAGDNEVEEEKTVPDKMELLGKELVFGGIVVNYSEGTTRKGNPYGRITIEDYSASFEVMLFANDFTRFRNYGIEGTSLLIRAAYVDRYNNGQPRLNIQSIELLNNLKGKLVHNIRINLHENQIPATTMIRDFLDDKATENVCDLFFRVHNEQSKQFVDLRAGHKLPIDKKVMELLQELNLTYEMNVN